MDILERKMDAKMRQMLTEELLRLGTAQARAAEEQVQESCGAHRGWMRGVRPISMASEPFSCIFPWF